MKWLARSSKSYSMVPNMSVSGRKVMDVPRSVVWSPLRRGPVAMPRWYFLVVGAAVAVDLGAEVAGERVDDGRSDAVESAGDLVGAAAELASGVEDGHDGL